MMGDVGDLVVWLREQLDEDERVAVRVLRFSRDSYARGAYETWVAERKVNNIEPPYYDYWQVRTERPGTVQRSVVRLDADMGGLDTEHIARFASPRRMLAEVDAKRRIVDRHVPRPDDRRVCAECGGAEWKPGIGHNGLDPYPWVMPWPCPTLRLLALPYADRLGYRQEWAP